MAELFEVTVAPGDARNRVLGEALLALVEALLVRGKVPETLSTSNGSTVSRRKEIGIPPPPCAVTGPLLAKVFAEHRMPISEAVRFATELESQWTACTSQVVAFPATKVDVGGLVALMRQKLLGCCASCPTCGRPCDVEHRGTPGSDGDLHGCQLGHGIRATQGLTLAGCKEASLKTCNRMERTDEVEHRGVTTTWDDFMKTAPGNEWNRCCEGWTDGGQRGCCE